MKRTLRLIAAGIVGLALTLGINAVGIAWMRASQFAGDASYDGYALFLTLAIPALLGGIAIGLIAARQGLYVAAISFVLFCGAGLFRPFWSIPLVSPESTHSGLMHYFLYNPLVALAFGSLGAWVASQFAVGNWKLADREPIDPSQLED